MTQYRKKPVVVDARLWNNDWNELSAWVDALGYEMDEDPAMWVDESDDTLCIMTLEGIMHASLGDWIICGVEGEFYPVKPGIFDTTYEPV